MRAVVLPSSPTKPRTRSIGKDPRATFAAEPARIGAAIRRLRERGGAVAGGDIGTVERSAAVALGRHVLDAVAVEIVAEGVSCSKKDKQCGKDKAEADPVASCAVGVRGRR